ncbi:hypothetical protein L1987_87612 [Smallanthus sonchifolius]|nr:hypothetical protein L1987_87612 [Smallanthus sonchifolius]
MATWAQDSIKAGHLMDMVDSDIRSEISRKCLKKFVKIIDICLDYNPKNRPTMDEVVRRLKKVLTLQERTTNGENIGMDFRSLVPKMPHIDMDFRSLVPKMPHKDMDFRSLVPKMPHIDMDFRSLMPNMLHVRMEFGSLMHKKKKKLLMLRESYFQEYGSSMSLEDKLKNGVGSIKIFRAKELKKATMDFAEDMIIGKGLKAVDYERRQEDRFLALYFVKAKRENRLLKIVDCQVLEEAVDEQLEEVCYLVCRCLDMRGENRPSMKEVTMELERIRKFSKRPLFTQDKSSIKVAMELERRRKLSMHSWGSQYNDDGTSSFMSESEQDGLYDNLSAYNDTFSM